MVDVVNIDDLQLTVALPDGQQITLNTHTSTCHEGDKITLGIRPEHLQLDDSKLRVLTLLFHADNVERLGNSTYLFGHYQEQYNFKVAHTYGSTSLLTEIVCHCILKLVTCILFDKTRFISA